MSANNSVVIFNDNSVYEVDADTGYGSKIGKGKNLEEAIGIARDYCMNEIVEYGIQFVTNYGPEEAFGEKKRKKANRPRNKAKGLT